MTIRVKAGVVTYTRTESLESCLASLTAQTHSLDDIIVVDNHPEESKENRLRQMCPTLTYLPHDNIGTAGGFGAILREAAGSCDYVWLFDDDVTMGSEVLEQIVARIPELEEQGRLGAVRPWYEARTDPTPIPIGQFAWRGVLVSTRAVAEVGYPDAELFMYGADIDYSLRIAKAGFRMFIVPDALINAGGEETKTVLTIGPFSTQCHTSPFRLYYGLRNELIVSRRHSMPGRYLKTNLYGLRLLPFASLAWQGSKSQALKAIAKGLWHGNIGRRGKLIDPRDTS